MNTTIVNDDPIVCVCPTYRRPQLLKNSVYLFLKQTIDIPTTLLIFDDGVCFEEDVLIVESKQVILRTFKPRFPTLGHKYNRLIETAINEFNAKYIFIWEDDDIYLPTHIEAYMDCFKRGAHWVKTKNVKTLFGGSLDIAPGARSYFASLAFARDAFDAGIRFVEDGHDNFDIFFMQELEKRYGEFCDPTDSGWDVSYIFRWDTTRSYHGQGYMRGIKNFWYEIIERITKEPENIERLIPEADIETQQIIENNKSAF